MNMRYFGGKNQDGVYHTIINQIPPHKRYIEPFLGGGAIMRRKRPADQENIGIDLDENAIRYFKSVLGEDKKIPNLKLINSNALKTLSLIKEVNWQFGPETFIYCDPPYPMISRTDKRSRYRFEMSDPDHMKLLDIIKHLKCPVMISTYPNAMYEAELKGWRKVSFNSVKSNGTIADELLFMNYPEPVLLHDYRYIGENSGNRQDINRRIQRTVKRILSWPKRERIKMLLKFVGEMPDDEKKYLLKNTGENAGAGAMTNLVEQAIPPAPDPDIETERK